MRAPESPFERYEGILSFAYLMCPSVSRPKARKNLSAICHIHFQWKVTEHFRNRIKKIWGVFVQKSLSLKKYFKRKIRRDVFVVYVSRTVKIHVWGQSDKFPMSFSFLQCPLQVKKLIRENSAKYVDLTGNFHFRPKLKTAISQPIFNLFQWFLFYIRDFIWIITLTEKLKFEENCRSEGRIL